MSSYQRRTIVVPNTRALAETAAQCLVDRIRDKTHAAVCLAGGSTPEQLYELLATPSWQRQIPWPRVHWFMGDERLVPLDDPLSNMGAARRAFLDACAPSQNIHAIPTTGVTADEAAQIYQRELKSFQEANRVGQPLFDLVLMGVGLDGHTASLFPNTPALTEQTRWVIGIDHADVEPFVSRVSLTLPCLARTHEMLFLVAGLEKRSILERIFFGDDLPAARARASEGKTLWLIDEAAAPQNLHQQKPPI